MDFIQIQILSRFGVDPVLVLELVRICASNKLLSDANAGHLGPHLVVKFRKTSPSVKDS